MKSTSRIFILLLVLALLLTACNNTLPSSTDTVASTDTEDSGSDETVSRELTEEEKLLISLKGDIKSAMTENTKEYKVLFCDASDNPTLAADEKAIWVVELFKAYPDSTDEAEAVITAVHIYYPMHDDPSDYTDSELNTMGVIRVFAYMGIPDNATSQNKVQGIVCTHGGEGHAYAKYCLEAVRHGYAAIAFDTEGYHALNGIEANERDLLGHKEKDNFSTAKNSIKEQWMYYVISDCAFANTVLRSLDAVDKDKVGITGISWGGLAVTVASCYDSRFAFCVPVYLSYFVSSQTNDAFFGSTEYNPDFDKFAADLWQDAETLEGNTVPTLLINSQKDRFADISSTVMTYKTLKKNNSKAYVLIKPDLPHSQEAGASQPEIYRFGDWVCSNYGNEKSFFTIDKQITSELGRSYQISVTVPENITNVSAILYYTTEPLSYSSSYTLEQSFKSVFISEDGVQSRGDGSSVYTYTVTAPDNAYLYYVSFYGESAYDKNIPITYTYSGSFVFNGIIFGSSSVVVVNNGAINKSP